MELTAIFESWHIEDGNYPPLRKGQQVNLSFEVQPSSVTQADAEALEQFTERGRGEYEFVGNVLRVYANYFGQPLTVVECVGFRFYINRLLSIPVGERVRGAGILSLDNYTWIEDLNQYPDLPNLFYQFVVKKIRHVQILESLGSSEDRLEHVKEIDDMKAQAFYEGIYLLNLTGEGVTGFVARTYQY